MLRWLGGLGWRRWLASLVLAGVAWHTWRVLVTYLPVQVAWGGWSPLHWVHVTLDPARAVVDWPSGIRHYAKSLWMWLYPAAAEVGLQPERLLPVMVGVDVLLWVASFGLLFRELSPRLPLGAWLLALLAAAFGTGVDLNLARFAQPFYMGLYYAAATAARNCAWVAALRGRWSWAGFWTGLAFTIHPTLGLLGAAGLVGVVVAELWAVRRTAAAVDWRAWLRGGGVACLVAGIWVAWRYEGTHWGLPTEVPHELWYGLTRMINSHWYPLERGVFTVNHTWRFLPALGLWALALPELIRLESRRRRFVAALWVVGLICVVVGVVISALPEPPLPLLKLALHRASDLVTYTALPLAVAFLWRLGGELPSPARLLMVVLLASPWLSLRDRGWPVLLGALLLAWYGWRFGRRADGRWARWAAAGLFGVVAGYALAGLARWSSASYSGLEPLLAFVRRVGPVLGTAVLVAVALAALVRPRVVALSLAVVLAWGWADRRFGSGVLGPARLAERQDYLAVQRWAAQHTPPTALFAPPPDVVFGWRDYSHRPSFGNVYEWLHTSWLYETDARLFQEGRARFATLGLPLERYLELPHANWAATVALITDVRRAYGTRDDAWRRALARRYGIDYFVLWAHAPAARATTMPVVYRNDHFVVLATGDGSHG